MNHLVVIIILIHLIFIFGICYDIWHPFHSWNNILLANLICLFAAVFTVNFFNINIEIRLSHFVGNIQGRKYVFTFSLNFAYGLYLIAFLSVFMRFIIALFKVS